MSAADKIQAARALIEPLTGHTEGPWWTSTRVRDGSIYLTMGESDTSFRKRFDLELYAEEGNDASDAELIAAAPALRNTVAALADLADAQAQENAKLRDAATVDVKPLEWRDLTYGMNPHWTANHPFGSIDIRQEDEDLEWRWVVRPFIGGRSNWPTLEEAKADAEADYLARVRAAIGDAEAQINRHQGCKEDAL